MSKKKKKATAKAAKALAIHSVMLTRSTIMTVSVRPTAPLRTSPRSA